MSVHGRPRRHRQVGDAVLYVILLSPVIILALAFAVEGGALQLQKERVRSAVDEAVVVAGSSAAVGGDGVQVDPRAADAAVRTAIGDNLRPLQDVIAGSSADEIARAADVAVVTAVPGANPFVPGETLHQPSVVARVRVPVRTGLLTAAGVPPTIELTVTASAAVRQAADH